MDVAQEHMDPVDEFAIHAYAGIQAIGHENTPYFRSCMLSLYINDTFSQLVDGSSEIENIFMHTNHSFICVLRAIALVSPIIFGYFDTIFAPENASHDELMEYYSTVCTAMFREENPLTPILEHDCEGPTLPEFRQDWIARGRPPLGSIVDFDELKDSDTVSVISLSDLTNSERSSDSEEEEVQEEGDDQEDEEDEEDDELIGR